MDVGQVCPNGFLPVYSVETEKTAKLLVTMTCKRDFDGNLYAPDLIDLSTGLPYAGKKRIDAFVRFGQRLEQMHREHLENKP